MEGSSISVNESIGADFSLLSYNSDSEDELNEPKLNSTYNIFKGYHVPGRYKDSDKQKEVVSIPNTTDEDEVNTARLSINENTEEIVMKSDDDNDTVDSGSANGHTIESQRLESSEQKKDKSENNTTSLELELPVSEYVVDATPSLFEDVSYSYIKSDKCVANTNDKENGKHPEDSTSDTPAQIDSQRSEDCLSMSTPKQEEEANQFVLSENDSNKIQATPGEESCEYKEVKENTGTDEDSDSSIEIICPGSFYDYFQSEKSDENVDLNWSLVDRSLIADAVYENNKQDVENEVIKPLSHLVGAQFKNKTDEVVEQNETKDTSLEAHEDYRNKQHTEETQKSTGQETVKEDIKEIDPGKFKSEYVDTIIKQTDEKSTELQTKADSAMTESVKKDVPSESLTMVSKSVEEIVCERSLDECIHDSNVLTDKSDYVDSEVKPDQSIMRRPGEEICSEIKPNTHKDSINEDLEEFNADDNSRTVNSSIETEETTNVVEHKQDRSLIPFTDEDKNTSTYKIEKEDGDSNIQENSGLILKESTDEDNGGETTFLYSNSNVITHSDQISNAEAPPLSPKSDKVKAELASLTQSNTHSLVEKEETEQRIIDKPVPEIKTPPPLSPKSPGVQAELSKLLITKKTDSGKNELSSNETNRPSNQSDNIEASWSPEIQQAPVPSYYSGYYINTMGQYVQRGQSQPGQYYMYGQQHQNVRPAIYPHIYRPVFPPQVHSYPQNINQSQLNDRTNPEPIKDANNTERGDVAPKDKTVVNIDAEKPLAKGPVKQPLQPSRVKKQDDHKADKQPLNETFKQPDSGKADADKKFKERGTVNAHTKL